MTTASGAAGLSWYLRRNWAAIFLSSSESPASPRLEAGWPPLRSGPGSRCTSSGPSSDGSPGGPGMSPDGSPGRPGLLSAGPWCSLSASELLSAASPSRLDSSSVGPAGSATSPAPFGDDLRHALLQAHHGLPAEAPRARVVHHHRRHLPRLGRYVAEVDGLAERPLHRRDYVENGNRRARTYDDRAGHLLFSQGQKDSAGDVGHVYVVAHLLAVAVNVESPAASCRPHEP